MARFAGVYVASHTPFCFTAPDAWDEMRAARQLRADVPLDSPEENAAKHARLQTAMATLRSLVEQAQPDVAIVVASDQVESFDFRNFPQIAVYAGDEFEGRSSSGEGRTRLRGHPEFATTVLRGLMRHGLDPAFCLDVPNPEKGLAHGLIWKAESMTGVDTPTVPILLNCHYGPQISGVRAYEAGRALRRVIEEDDSDLRVVVVGTGGLWHTPGAPGAYLDEAFDSEFLRLLESGDVRSAAEFFDAYPVSSGDESQAPGRVATGMPLSSGPQGGTRQVCNWIAAAAAADGAPFTIVDYVPVYASPIGAGFAYSAGA